MVFYRGKKRKRIGRERSKRDRKGNKRRLLE
jgi:hypothetical protein